MEQTLKELLEVRKSEEDRGIIFIYADTEEVFVSYRDLYIGALDLLYLLQLNGFLPGDEVVFQITDNRKFIYSFWACQLGGMVPVPVTTGDNEEHKLKLFKIWNILTRPRLIFTDDFMERLEKFSEEHGMMEVFGRIQRRGFCFGSIDNPVHMGQTALQKPEDLAFIQFSSGSTGDPKGVMITHLNAFTNISAAAEWMEMTQEDICLNWMPLTHDMGLIGTHLKSIFLNINQYNIHTNLFIRRPQLWMKKVSEHKATLLYSPNFGYKYFLKYFKDKEDLDWDLSSVRMFYNGAEPISLELCDEFLDKLAPYGLKKNTMHTVYGLAEGTIAVTFPPLNSDTKKHILNREHLGIGDYIVPAEMEDNCAIVFADEGYPIRDCYVKICNEQGEDIGENRIGYIHIRGGNVTQGYYKNPEESKRVINQEGWLNTSDLGFMQNGRLTVTGRVKDIIFVNGQNYYSHDIERVAEECDGVEMGKVVAVGAFNRQSNRDELIIFLLFKGSLEKFMPYIRLLKEHIFKRIGVRADHVIPVKKIYKTTSGKVQRYKFRDDYTKGKFTGHIQEIEQLLPDTEKREILLPVTDTQEKLLSIWVEIFETENISTEDDFFSLGGDSLKVTQLLARIQEYYGITMEYQRLFEASNIIKQAELIDKEGRGSDSSKHAIVKYVKSDYPLSFSQQRMWFLDHLNNQSPQYNLCRGILLDGVPDSKLLERSLNETARRHKILKMSFSEEKGIPVQIYNADLYIKMENSDLTSMPEEERNQAGLAFAEKISNTPFDLSKPPLIKAAILKLNNDKFLLILCTHHILFDGWSFGIVIQELMDNYKALSNKDTYTAKEAEFQYVDYANWQVNMLATPELIQQVNYWKKQLPTDSHPINLPFDKVRPAIQSFNGALLTGTVNKEMAEKVKRYAILTNTTPFMVLFSAFMVLLYRYSLDKELYTGISSANRNHKDTEKIIGYFTNNLVIRTKIEDNSDFLSLVQAVKKTMLEAYENQDVPFDKLVEELKVTRDMSMNPLFQVMFTMQNTKLPRLSFKGIEGSYITVGAGYARFDLAVDVFETQDSEFLLQYEYNTDLFLQGTILRMSENYNMLLNNLLKNPKVLLEEVEILAEEEKEELLSSYLKTEKKIEKGNSFAELFEEQAVLNPDQTAVACAGNIISYRELNQRANRIAGLLRQKGIGSESIVAIYLDRSIDLPAAILGIFKTGAAYLPMDPIFPPSRLSYMIANAKVCYIISKKEMLGTMPESNAEIILLEDENLPDEPENFSCTKSARDLAYILYTSGSTGNPKGVQIEQGALTNFLQSMKDSIGISESDRWLAVTTISFDISIMELLLPLICGAAVFIAKREDVFDGKRLLTMIGEEKITVMQATPATWKLMLQAGFERIENLKILCGGEALPKLLAEELVKRGSILINLYGPTETTIWSTAKVFKESAEHITIGTPIANTSVYVLDTKLKPVPIGVPGELFIGGAGLARGYYGLQELTDEKFIENPFYGEKDPSERIYRTGDIVRYLDNGELEYLQRMDNQVKIRGFRIELDEIQVILSAHPLVRECVIAVKDTKQNEKIIAAYMLLKEGTVETDIRPDEVRAFLKAKLPEYMIPSAFIVMDAFPLTLNKKVDLKALPDPAENRILLTKEFEEATNEIEKTLMEIWKEVLNIPKAGIKDNFFDLGGYSMLLAQVRSLISEKLGKDIPMIELFKYPTIQSLAEYLSGEKDAEPQNTQADSVENSGNKKGRSREIAVIGMSGRFPGAENINQFWDNLCGGVESIARFDKKTAIENGASDQDTEKAEYVTAWGALGEIDKFDARFFGYNPKEATVLDPQQRIFLEEVWKAFEHAGYNPEDYSEPVGVFAGVGMNTYMDLLAGAGFRGSLANDYQVMTSNDKDFLSTRVSYKLNLTGPSYTVQTACSSSLLAVHQACASLISGECTMAVAGGVSIRIPEKKGYLYQEGMILSKDGHCRAFDQSAGGTVGGNGAGAVILKRYEDAVADKDEIFAVIKGSAVNNDGSQKIGYTAPSVQGQTRAIQKALRESGIPAEQISYVEAHGTGTSLGDPIEIEALTKAFGTGMEKGQYCAVGSVKTNVGHLDAAAGITGFIKAVLSIKNRKILPSLNYKEANSAIAFKDSPFYVNTKLREYEGKEAFSAGISSFGIGGTNVHVVIQEDPLREQAGSCTGDKKSYLIPVSAKSPQALYQKCRELKEFLTNEKQVNITDMAYTLSAGRKELEYRHCFAAGTIQDVREGLDSFLTENKPVKEIDLSKSQRQLYGRDEYTMQQLADAWIKGAVIPWKELYTGENPRHIPLPVYPFERVSYWPKAALASKFEKTPEEFYYAPVWEQSVENISKPEHKKTAILLIEEDTFFLQSFAKSLRECFETVYLCRSGEAFYKLSDKEYVINIRRDFDRLLQEIMKEIDGELTIIPTFAFTSSGKQSRFDLEKDIDYGEESFFCLMYLAKAIGNRGNYEGIRIKAVTGAMRRPGLSLMLGALKVIPKEYNGVLCSDISIDLCGQEDADELDLAQILAAEAVSDSKEAMIAYRGQERYIQTYRKIKLSGSNKVSNAINKDEVCLITGGLGGIGLQIAQELVDQGCKKLVFLQRNAFFREEDWKNCLETLTEKTDVCHKIRILTGLKEKGADVKILQGDVTSKEEVSRIRLEILEQFGRIDTIIHAAGTPGGGMLQIKEEESVKKVFNAKVKGTSVLYHVFKEDSPKRMVLFSSLNAVTGGFGQSDYSAANAYMDAFAGVFDKQSGIRITAIDWERWPGIGMAKQPDALIQKKEYELLGRQIFKGDKKNVYLKCFDPDLDWVLADHHVFRVPTAAGTTYLEMAREAYEDVTKEKQCVIQDVVFMAPLSVPFGKKRNVLTILNKIEDQYEFAIASAAENEEEQGFMEHVKGRIVPGRTAMDRGIDPAFTELLSKKYSKIQQSAQLWDKNESGFIYFGNRWKSLQWLSAGETEAFGKIVLPEEFEADLDKYPMHPAMLDVATGALRFVSGGNYLPFSYQSITFRKQLEKEIYTRLSYSETLEHHPDFITCDITVYNAQGECLTEIKNFAMRLVESEEKLGGKDIGKLSKTSEIYNVIWSDIIMNKKKEENILLDGLTSAEGKAAFTEILYNSHLSRIIVSKKDINDAISESGYLEKLLKKKETAEKPAEQEMHDRQEMRNAYAECRNETEEKIRDIWQPLLAIRGIGIHDEFFELGGDSLMLIQLHTSLKESFKKDFPVVDLYKYNTIALQAKLLSCEKDEDQKPVFDQVNGRVNTQREKMQQRRKQMQKMRGGSEK